MTAQRLGAIETSPEMSIDDALRQNVSDFQVIHNQLSQLPQDPNEPLQDMNIMLADMGAVAGNDFSMFIMGAMGKVGMDAGADALHLPADGAISTSVDFATDLLKSASEQREQRKPDNKKEGPNKKEGATSMFRLSKVRPLKTHGKAPKNGPSPTIMREAAMRKQRLDLKRTAAKRNGLKKAMKTHMENIKELVFFKQMGVTGVHRISVINAQTGEPETYHVAAKEKPQLALSLNGKQYEKPIDVSMVCKPSMAPKFAMGF